MSGKSKKTKKRDWLPFVMPLIFFFLVLLGVSLYTYLQMSENIISDIDKRLFVGAASIKSLLPEDFHDRAADSNSISAHEDNTNIRALSEFADKISFKFLYTLIKIDDAIYITSSNATQDELINNEEVKYYTQFDEADSSFYTAFESDSPVSFTHKDRWGNFRALAIQEISPEGKKYLSVAEYDISFVKNILSTALAEVLLGAVLLLLGTVPLFYTFIQRMQRQSEEQQVMEKQLQQAQKMESIGRLAGGVAHDYNNISSVIIGYSELALERVNKSDPLYDHLVEIIKASERSTDITKQLLAFARRQTIAPRILDLDEEVESRLKMLRRLIGEDIELTWEPGTPSQLIKMDPSQIDQVLANLCINSRDAITDVGHITIETKNISFDKDYCAVHEGFLPGDYVMLAVSDNGNGIASDKMDKIFEPFFTTKDGGKGTGLGLATVYGIVKQNNGFITVYSEPGNGTTLRIYLPIVEGGTAETENENDIEIPKSDNETILIVEDDVTILNVAKKTLKGLGYKVLCSDNPDDAIRLVSEYDKEIHLLLTDVIMPGMNGRELYQNIQPLCPDIEVLYMSGYTSNIIAHRGVLEDGVSFIPKPFSKKDIAVKIRKVLERKTGHLGDY